MERFDFVIIGAGPAGEAAAYKARALGASVAIADRLWFGGSCPHIGCLPSKALLHSSEVHAAGTDYPWRRASERRDYIINRPREAAEPDDGSHVEGLRDAGAVTYRGDACIVANGRVRVSHDDVAHEIEAENIVVAVGSVSKTPPIEVSSKAVRVRTARPPWPASCRKACSCSAVDRPAASLPRSSSGSASRRRSSSPVRV